MKRFALLSMLAVAIVAGGCGDQSARVPLAPTTPSLSMEEGDPTSTAGSIDYVSSDVSAQEVGIESVLGPRATVLSTDFRSAGVGSMRNVGTGTITVTGISGPVRRAFLYWQGPTNTNNPALGASVRINGTLVTGVSLGFSSDNCWGMLNSIGWVADVTSIVQAAGGNGNYALTGFGASSGANGVNTTGASLVVFYNDADPLNDRDVYVVDGNDANFTNPPFDAPGWDATVAGINYTSGSANLQLHVADGQTFSDGAVLVNGTTIAAAGAIFQGFSVPPTGNGPFGNGRLWDIVNFNVTPRLTPGVNTLRVTSPAFSDCLSLVVAIVDVRAANRAPIARITGATTTAEGTTITLTSESTDPDGDALTQAWKVNGVPAGSGTSLDYDAADGPATVTFELTVTDPKGASDSETHTLSVTNVAPTVTAGPDGVEIFSGDVFTFNASFFDPGLQDTPWTSEIDWGFGDVERMARPTQDPFTASKRYLRAGSHTIGIGLTDKDGGRGDASLGLLVKRLPLSMIVWPDPIQLTRRDRGMIVVVIMSSEQVDATTISPATATLGDGLGPEASVATMAGIEWQTSTNDVNGDGRADMVLTFREADVQQNGDLGMATAQLILLADLHDGRQIRATGSVRVLP